MVGSGFLLLAGCSKEEELLLPANGGEHQQLAAMEVECQLTPTEVFLQDYHPRDDEFRDRIVSGMMAHDSVSGIIYNITYTYGQPLWSTTRAHRVGSCSSLFVPLAAPDCDSIAAVMVFRQRPDSSGIIDYYILTNHNPDTTITDFILHCQTSVYGRGFYPDRVTVPVTDRAQHVMITYCWQTWSAHHDSNGEVVLDHLNYESCHTYLPLDVSTNFNQGEQGSFGGGGGGGSSSSNNNNNNNSNNDNNDSNEEEENNEEDDEDEDEEDEENNCRRALTTSEVIALNNAINQIQMENHCPTNKFLDALQDNITYMVDTCYEGRDNAVYSITNGSIYFYGTSNINSQNIYEELFHAYQDKFYGGLSKYYMKPGYTNIEFEAKLMQTMYCLFKGNIGEMNFYNTFSDFEAFRNWIYEYLENGTTDSFWTGYYYYLSVFQAMNPSYAGYTSVNFPVMQIINKLIKGCQILI